MILPVQYWFGIQNKGFEHLFFPSPTFAPRPPSPAPDIPQQIKTATHAVLRVWEVKIERAHNKYHQTFPGCSNLYTHYSTVPTKSAVLGRIRSRPSTDNMQFAHSSAAIRMDLRDASDDVTKATPAHCSSCRMSTIYSWMILFSLYSA